MTLAGRHTGTSTGAHALARYRGEFPIFRDGIYLNTCSLGALGERTRRRVVEFLDVWQRRGASAWYDVWWEALGELRARHARVVNAGPAEIALAPSISVALSAVAEALDYTRRPRVVVTSLDFPTVAYQWVAKRPRGVELVVVESPDRISVPVEAIARAVDERTALVVTSHVYFTSGAIQDITAVAEVAHRRGALTLVDAYQSVGQVPVDVRAAGVDFLTAGGLKWLLGGPGIVFLYAREEVTRRLAPEIAGWFGHKTQFASDPRVLELPDDARRCELGTPSLAAVYAQLGGLDYIEEIGVPAIRGATAELTEDLIGRARDLGFRPKVAPRAEQRSAIVMLPAADPAAGVRLLAGAGIRADPGRRSVLCARRGNRAAARPGGLSAHHRWRARDHGGGQPRLSGGQRPVDRLQYRAAVRAGAQPLRGARHQLPLLLRSQDDVRQVFHGVHRLPRRVRHDGRAVRGADADPDREGEAFSGDSVRPGVLAGAPGG